MNRGKDGGGCGERTAERGGGLQGVDDRLNRSGLALSPSPLTPVMGTGSLK